MTLMEKLYTKYGACFLPRQVQIDKIANKTERYTPQKKRISCRIFVDGILNRMRQWVIIKEIAIQ